MNPTSNAKKYKYTAVYAAVKQSWTMGRDLLGARLEKGPLLYNMVQPAAKGE